MLLMKTPEGKFTRLKSPGARLVSLRKLSFVRVTSIKFISFSNNELGSKSETLALSILAVSSISFVLTSKV